MGIGTFPDSRDFPQERNHPAGRNFYGSTPYSHLVQNSRLMARYRCNILRKWLFYKLETEITWPLNTTGGYTAYFAFTMRLEIVFQGTGKIV